MRPYKTLAAFRFSLASRNPAKCQPLLSALDFLLAQTKQILMPVIRYPKTTRDLLRQVTPGSPKQDLLLLADGW